MKTLAFFIFLLLSAAAHAQTDSTPCSSALPPAIAVAQGLTQLALCDDFPTTASIDTADTRNPASCTGATFPNGQCHWYVHNKWPSTASLYDFTSTLYPNNLLWSSPYSMATDPGDYSATTITGPYGVWGVNGNLILAPRTATLTGNNTLGSSTITGLPVTTTIAPVGVVTGPGLGGTLQIGYVYNGTTATLTSGVGGIPYATTVGSVGGSYTFTAIYPGFQMMTCAANPSGSGVIGQSFAAPYFIDVQAFAPVSATPANFWALPTEWWDPHPIPSSTNILNVTEWDLFQFSLQFLIDASINQDRRYYWSGDNDNGLLGPHYTRQTSEPGATHWRGMLLLPPSSNAGGPGVGIQQWVVDDIAHSTMTYGPAVAPVADDGSTAGFGVGTFAPLGTGHYCLMVGAGAGTPVYVYHVRVWTVPTSVVFLGGGRRGVFR